MKNLKKILLILSAVMVIATCAASFVYADEVATEPTENVSDENSLELVECPIWIRPLIKGDVNIDSTLDVRDCAYIASKLAQGKKDELPECADYNSDGKVDVRDAAAIAGFLAKK